MKINFFKNVLPHLIAVICFYLLTVIMYYPAFTSGKKLEAGDITQWEGSAKEIIDYREANNEEALWSNSMFSGMPSYLISTQFSGDLMVYIQKAMYLGMPRPYSLILISMICFYILLISSGVRPYLAMICSFGYGFTTFLSISLIAGHIAKVAAIAFLPLPVAGFRLLFHKKILWGFVLFAIGLALEIRVNHLQITYYLLLILVIYGISELWYYAKNKSLDQVIKPAVILIIATILAVGANFGKLWTVYEYGKYSTRGAAILEKSDAENSESGLGREYVFRYSNGLFEPLVMMIPNILGGSSAQALDKDSNTAKAFDRNGIRGPQRSQLSTMPTYWGDQPYTAPYYAGAIMIFLAILGIVVLDARSKWWLVVVLALGLILSMGKNLSFINYFFYDYLPGYNKFRSVTFSIIIAIFALNYLAGLGIARLFEMDSAIAKKSLLRALYIAGGICVLSILVSFFLNYQGQIDSRLPDWLARAIRADRKSLLISDAFRSLAFILIAAILLYLNVIKKINFNILILTFTVLLAIDYISVNRRFLKKEAFVRENTTRIATTEADKLILANNIIGGRVLNLQNPFNESKTSYHHSSIGGYHGAKMRRYQDLIERHLTPEIEELIQLLQSGNRDFSSLGVLNMLNTTYFTFGQTKDQVVPNPHANEAAWLVETIEPVSSPDEEINRLKEINTATTALIDSNEEKVDKLNYRIDGQITLVEKQPNELKYQYSNSNPAFAVFSEIYYPVGWEAYIGDKKVDIKRVNYLLRGLELPAGKHEITFTFSPDSYTTGNTVMLASNLLIFILIGVFAYLEFKKKETVRN